MSGMAVRSEYPHTQRIRREYSLCVAVALDLAPTCTAEKVKLALYKIYLIIFIVFNSYIY